MIGRLQGIIIDKTPPDILLDVGGVGYEVQLPMTCYYQLPEAGQSVSIFTHFVVREDANLLFGFSDKATRSLFRILIKANGVGPKLACTILSGMSASQFGDAVLREDITALVKMPGVGKKTAERLVVELKDKIASLDSTGSFMSTSTYSTIAPEQVTNSAKDEAISALIALGYKPVQAEKAIKQVYADDSSSEELIRQALKSMA